VTLHGGLAAGRASLNDTLGGKIRMSHRYMAHAHPRGQSGPVHGYYRMARGWLDHELFDGEPYCPRAAWEWLIAQAVWRPKTISGTPFTLDRGQLSYSLRYLAEAWQWSIARVRGFLAKLAKRHMIRTDHVTGSRTGRLVITVCNYERYQGRNAADRTAGDTEAAHASHKKERTNAARKVPDGTSSPIVPPAHFVAASMAAEMPASLYDGVGRPAAEDAAAPGQPAAQQPENPAPDPAAAPAEANADFAAFCAAYPQIVDERATRKALAEALQKVLIGEILASAEAYVAWLALPRNATVPMMNSANWLRHERWRDQRRPWPPDQQNQRRFAPVVTPGTGTAHVEPARRSSPSQTVFDAARIVSARIKHAQHFPRGAEPDFRPGCELAATTC
jgi:hypothetical protein